MASTAIIGNSFTFQALFRDADGTPLAVNAPTINVFYFDDTGTRVDAVAPVAMTAPSPAEVGRYVHVYTIPTTFTHGDTLTAEMTGTHPISGDTLAVLDTLLLQSASTLQTGLRASFFG